VRSAVAAPDSPADDGRDISTTAALTFGTDYTKGTFLTGSIDELRISNKVRYPVNYNPDVSEFVADANTLALWHLNSLSGSVISDSSPNNISGSVVGSVSVVRGATSVGGISYYRDSFTPQKFVSGSDMKLTSIFQIGSA
jgi:hypothetical protein